MKRSRIAMKKNKEIWILMARYLAGEMETKEEIEFRESVERDGEIKKELNQMEKSWTHLNDTPLPGDNDSRKAWEKLHRSPGGRRFAGQGPSREQEK